MAAARSVFLCGFSGAGKTETGRILARLLELDFFDTDEAIAAELGMSISEAFDTIGEPRFREIEKEVIRDVGSAGARVIALGGGAVAEKGNLEFVKRHGLVIYLRVSPATVFARLQTSHLRPKLGGGSESSEARRTAIASLMKEREPFYRQADLTVDTEGKSPAEVAAEIERLVNADERYTINRGQY